MKKIFLPALLLASFGVAHATIYTTNWNSSFFFADTSSGGVSTVQNWGVQMDIVAVPEAETWVAAALARRSGLLG